VRQTQRKSSVGAWLAALALLALVVGVWLQSRLGDGARSGGQVSAPEASGSRGVGTPERVDGERGASDSRSTLAEEARADELAPSAAREQGVELIAILGAHRQRVTPVELWWWQPQDLESWQELQSVERWMRAGELDERLAQQAQPLAPDANGAFHAPTPLAVGCVIARAQGLWGFSSVLRASTDPTYVELESYETLRVRVLDAAGASAPRARVVLRQLWPAEDAAPATTDLAMLTTDSDGRAEFRHYRGLMRGAWDFDARVVLAVAEPFAQAVEFEFDPTRPPVETVELRLPACGSVVLEVDGDARAARFSLQLAPALASEDALELQGGDYLRPESDGLAHFPYVGLGLLLTPTSLVDGRLTLHAASAALGPSRPGEERRLRVAVHAESKPQRRMVGTLVGPALSSSGTTRVDISLRGQDSSDVAWTQGLRVLVLPDGRFLIPLLREAAGPTQLEFTALGPREEIIGRCEVTAVASAGVSELDLGTIFLDARSLLVAGRVLDAAGRRVVGAQVRVFGTRHRGASTDLRGWERSEDLQVRTGLGGEFEVRGDGDWTALGVCAWSSDGASEFRVVEVGSREVVLSLAADGALSGSISLAAGLAREYVRVGVRPEGARSAPRGAAPDRRTEVDAQGEFVVRGLAPGAYTVTVYASGAPTHIAQVQGVLVEVGQLARDPRLDPLEIGSWSVLRVLDADGLPANRASAHVLDRGARRWLTHAMPSGKLMLERDAAPLWLAAPGHVIARFDPATRAPAVQLERAPRVQVEVAPELLESIAGLELELVLQSADLPPAIERMHAQHIAIDRALSEPFGLHQAMPLSSTLVLTLGRSIDVPHLLLANARASSSPSARVLTLQIAPADLASAAAQVR